MSKAVPIHGMARFRRLAGAAVGVGSDDMAVFVPRDGGGAQEDVRLSRVHSVDSRELAQARRMASTSEVSSDSKNSA